VRVVISYNNTRITRVLKHTIKLPAGNLPSPPTQLITLIRYRDKERKLLMIRG